MASRKKNNDNDATAIQNEFRDLYVKLLQDYRGNNSLSYDRLASDVVRDPKLGLQYDREVMEQAVKEKVLPVRASGAIAQGPYVQSQLNADKQQEVDEYLAALQTTYATAREAQQNPANERPQLRSPTVVPDAPSSGKAEKPVAPKSSREAEDYALSLVQMLDQRRINTDRLSINVNGETVFKMRDGDLDPTKTKISNEHTELIKKALNDPASFNGSVKITQGNQVLLHVRDGRVLVDAVGLSKQSAKIEVKAPDSPNHGLYERFSQGVSNSGWQATKSIATNALKAGIEPDRVIGMLRERDPSYQKLASSQGEVAANRTLEKIVNRTQADLTRTSASQQQEVQQKTAKAVKV